MRARYTSQELDLFAAKVLRDGFCLLPRHLDPEKLRYWNDNFAPLLTRHIQREGELKNRGPGRYYVTLPFVSPWADPEIFEDPDILAMVERLVGQDPVMCQLATDTPLLGSDYQETHRDAPPLFPELERETPPFQLAINFPLIDVTSQNGPLEIARGTHLMTKACGLAKLETHEVSLESIAMNLGDVMVRDVRALHRGTPNYTGIPRPMVVVGYSRRWLFRPEVSIRVPDKTFEGLSARARRLLRFNPRVVEASEDEQVETYQAYAY
jgi:ectoine hydroxylase-related dioxygenase (phytanoyl-CoA dioxygenase family)